MERLVQDQSLQLMNELLSKLMILNYEEEFCALHDITPFPPAYFVTQSRNPGVQFQHFIDLASYLAQVAGRSFSVDRYDDPSASVNKLMLDLNDAGFVADFPPTRLRQPFGEPVCRVLNYLSDLALQARGFRWNTPQYPREDLAEEAEADDEAEVGGDDVADEAIVADDVDEDEVLFSELATGAGGGMERETELDTSAQGVMEPAVDPSEWRTEVERVSQRLRAPKTAGGKEWRSHLEQTHTHREVLERLFPDARNSLERTEAELSDLLERVGSKEKFLNSTFRSLNEEYRSTQSRLEEVSEEHQATTQRVNEMTNEVSALQEQLEDVGSQMKERGTSMTDTAPLVRIKSALSKLRSEMKSMDLRIGVAGHTLMQSKMTRARATAGPAELDMGAEGEEESGIELSGEDDENENDFSPVMVPGQPPAGAFGRRGL